MSRISLGVAGALDHAVIRELAPRLEQAGFHALWVNDTPGADALPALAVAAAATSTLALGAGVIPLDRRTASEIADTVRELGLPEHRLVVGVGSGGLRTGALDAVRDAVRGLRALTTARVVVGALGPRMRAVAAEEADGALLNWVTPEVARADGGERVILYARTIADPAARERLVGEAERYARIPQYAAHFARHGIDPLDTTIDLVAHPERLPEFASSVDELVLRAITPADALADYARVVVAAAPLGRLAGSRRGWREIFLPPSGVSWS